MLGNHDYWRIAIRYGETQARVAAMLLLTLRGTPTIYYGEEIGMTDVPVPPEREQDPWGLNQPGFSRDPCRTPMQWSAAPNAGFSAPETGELWLPLASDYQEANVERQLEDPASMLSLYRRLLAYRRGTPALQWGDYQPVDAVPDPCYVFLRQAGDERVLVILNFSGEEQRVTLPGLSAGSVAVSTHLDRTEAIEGENLVLRGDEGVIIELSGR